MRQPDSTSISNVASRVIKKLKHAGYELDALFEVPGGCVLSLRRGSEYVVVYILPSEDRYSTVTRVLDTIAHVVGYREVFVAEMGALGEVSLLKREPQPDREIASRCKMFLRILTSISEGQWFDHIRHRSKLRGRASVELIRAIRVLEEMRVVSATWRKFGAGSQHTLTVSKRLSKGELAYFLARLLNVAREGSLIRA